MLEARGLSVHAQHVFALNVRLDPRGNTCFSLVVIDRTDECRHVIGLWWCELTPPWPEVNSAPSLAAATRRRQSLVKNHTFFLIRFIFAYPTQGAYPRRTHSSIRSAVGAERLETDGLRRLNSVACESTASIVYRGLYD